MYYDFILLMTSLISCNQQRHFLISGLREKGLAPYAEHWLKQPIFELLEMDQQVCFSNCFSKLMIFGWIIVLYQSLLKMYHVSYSYLVRFFIKTILRKYDCSESSKAWLWIKSSHWVATSLYKLRALLSRRGETR